MNTTASQTCIMDSHTEDDLYAAVDARLDADFRLLLQLVLASGVSLLAFFGWITTL